MKTWKAILYSILFSTLFLSGCMLSGYLEEKHPDWFNHKSNQSSGIVYLGVFLLIIMGVNQYNRYKIKR